MARDDSESLHLERLWRLVGGCMDAVSIGFALKSVEADVMIGCAPIWCDVQQFAAAERK